MNALRVRDRVTNALGWHGVIQRIEPFTDGLGQPGLYYWVKWRERAESPDSWQSRQPTIGHLSSQIWRDGG